MYIYTYVYFFLSSQQSVCVPLMLSYLYVCVSTCACVCMSVCVYVCFAVCLSIFLSVYLSVCVRVSAISSPLDLLIPTHIFIPISSSPLIPQFLFQNVYADIQGNEKFLIFLYILTQLSLCLRISSYRYSHLLGSLISFYKICMRIHEEMKNSTFPCIFSYRIPYFLP